MTDTQPVATENLLNDMNFQQELFYREYHANGGNGVAAAQAAGYGGTYQSAAVQASRLVNLPKGQAYLRKLRDEQLRQHHLGPDQILEELARVAGFDLGDIMRVDKQGLPYIDMSGATKAHTRALASIETEEVSRGRGDDKEFVTKAKVKPYDKLKALELLMRHLGMLKDQTVAVQVNVDFGERMEARRRRALEDRT